MKGTAALFALLLPAAAAAQQPASHYLGRLPDGEEKRRFIIDCTGCHQFDSVTVGQQRTREQWTDAVTRMLAFAGPASNFPIISAYRDPARTAAFLTQALHPDRLTARPPDRLAPPPDRLNGRADIREYRMSNPGDLLHDLAIDSAGRVVVTGMFSSRMFVLDPATGATSEVPTPGNGARAVEIDSAGNWQVLLGGPRLVARYDPRAGTWSTADIGMYPHSIGIGAGGRVWFNGHFTHDPELIGYVENGAVRTFTVPAHPHLAPIPYELRMAPDGRVWMSELLGNRMIAFDPATSAFQVFTLPTAFSGPRRFDIARDGTVWIPAYSGNMLVRLDPRSGRFDEFPFPENDVLPYVARVDHRTGQVWIGTGAADAAYSFDPRPRQFTRYALPSRGALVRHLAIDPRNGDVWLAYGASPSRIPARVARLRVTR